MTNDHAQCCTENQSLRRQVAELRESRDGWRFLFFVLLAFLVCTVGAMLTSSAQADEVSECRRLAPKYHAEPEVLLADGTRCDLVNDEYAIEVDWAKPGKHFEAVGQSLYYAIVTGKKPGIILLVTDWDQQQRYVYRTMAVAAKHGIRLWIERISEAKEQLHVR